MTPIHQNGEAWSPAYKQFRFVMQWINASNIRHNPEQKAMLASRETGLPFVTVRRWVDELECVGLVA